MAVDQQQPGAGGRRFGLSNNGTVFGGHGGVGHGSRV